MALLISASGISYAQISSALSIDLPDSRTLAIQDKVDSLFDAGDFERAFFIYRNELVPRGDKYAQYMVGYMYLSGLGVEEDTVTASAWYRLAAERGTPEFIAVRERLLRTMTDGDISRSDERYLELRREYCDLAVLLNSIKSDMNALENRTDTRLGAQSSPVSVIENRLSRARSGYDYHSDIREHLEVRLRLLIEAGDFQDIDPDPDRLNIHELERRVEQRINFGVD